MRRASLALVPPQNRANGGQDGRHQRGALCLWKPAAERGNVTAFVTVGELPA